MLHGGRFAGQRLQGIVLTLTIRHFQGRLDQGAQLLETDRLGQIIEGSRLERGHSVFGAAVGSNHRHRHLSIVFSDVADNVESVAIR